MENLASFVCLSCFVQAVLYFGAALGAVFALRSFTRGADLRARFLVPLHARLGSCRPCIQTSVVLLAVSVAALAIALHYPSALLILVFLSLTTGLLLSLSIAHLFMFFWKKNAAETARLQDSTLAETPSQKCCGQK